MCVLMMVFGGCGVISRLGTESSHERKVEAEYDLSEHGEGKILVLVRQPYLLGSDVNLRYHLSERLNKILIKKMKVPAKNVISYDQLLEFRSKRSDFLSLSVREAGQAIGAQLVLYVMVDRYELAELPEPDFYNGYFQTSARVVEVSSGRVLWPKAGGHKTTKVGFDLETGGSEKAVSRLIAANAHCIARYLYDSPAKFFKIADDRSRQGWEEWTH